MLCTCATKQAYIARPAAISRSARITYLWTSTTLSGTMAGERTGERWPSHPRNGQPPRPGDAPQSQFETQREPKSAPAPRSSSPRPPASDGGGGGGGEQEREREPASQHGRSQVHPRDGGEEQERGVKRRRSRSPAPWVDIGRQQQALEAARRRGSRSPPHGSRGGEQEQGRAAPRQRSSRCPPRGGGGDEPRRLDDRRRNDRRPDDRLPDRRAEQEPPAPPPPRHSGPDGDWRSARDRVQGPPQWERPRRRESPPPPHGGRRDSPDYADAGPGSRRRAHSPDYTDAGPASRRGRRSPSPPRRLLPHGGRSTPPRGGRRSPPPFMPRSMQHPRGPPQRGGRTDSRRPRSRSPPLRDVPRHKGEGPRPQRPPAFGGWLRGCVLLVPWRACLLAAPAWLPASDTAPLAPCSVPCRLQLHRIGRPALVPCGCAPSLVPGPVCGAPCSWLPVVQGWAAARRLRECKRVAWS